MNCTTNRESASSMYGGLVRILNGRCLPSKGGVLSKHGELLSDCNGCKARCGGELQGYSNGVEVVRTWGEDTIELRWGCPSCGARVVQSTTALRSFEDANEVKRDPLCYRCRRTS